MTGPLAEASRADDLAGLVAIDTSTATPTSDRGRRVRRASGRASPGPASCTSGRRSTARGGSRSAAPRSTSRTGFGATTAYDVAAAGPAELRYASNRPRARSVSLLQALLWVAVLLAASRIALPARLRPRRTRDETLIDLDAEPGAGLPDHDRTGFAGWVDELFDEEDEPSTQQEESR